MSGSSLKVVRSRENPAYRALLRLIASARERRNAGQMVLEGERLVRAYLDTLGGLQRLVLGESAAETAPAQALMRRVPSAAILVLADRLLNAASGLEAPDGVLALAPRPALAVPGTCDSMMLLEDLQDPGNVGSIIRTCAAGAIQTVQLSAQCADPWSPKALRAGMGGHFATVVRERVDLVAAAREFHGQVVAAVPDAPTSLFTVDLTGPVAFVIGNEGAGISPPLQAAATRRVRLPMPGAVDSLNAAAAAAVCVFERVRQLGASAGGRR